MTAADDRLKALFAQDEPPPRDPAFSAAVIERLERRRCLYDLLFLAVVSGLGGVALWALWPVLEPAVVALSGRLSQAAVALVLALSALSILRIRPGEVLRLES
jgi:hypothetical protein